MSISLKAFLQEEGIVYSGNDCVLTSAAPLMDAMPTQLTFLNNPKYAKAAHKCKASVILVPIDFESNDPRFIPCENPYATFAKFLQQLKRINFPFEPGIHPSSHVHPSVHLSPNTAIGPGVVIEEGAEIGSYANIKAGTYIGKNCRIGDHFTTEPQARILDGSIIGHHCYIQSGATIGSTGFGYAPLSDGSYTPIPHLGHVELEDHVEIGANTTIDRGTMSATRIGKGSKIDNLCQIAHNVTIGQHCVLAAQVGIAGSTTIGSYCMIGGQVGVVGHLKIGNGVQILAQSGVMKSVKDKEVIFGSPAMEKKAFLKAYAAFRKNGK